MKETLFRVCFTVEDDTLIEATSEDEAAELARETIRKNFPNALSVGINEVHPA